ncbi:hypothetical protein COT47_03870 [Candidatus Woesearchaeota archaeon CG08_land_8_20_14_0_20_43_7]|nr:MAG: hypothetical protein COT47_03870 [Candidatus Woesearchaeota archaeon CG08_land_8_20_14_0_20_43_7]
MDCLVDKKIKIDYTPEPIGDGDMVVAFFAGSLEIIGQFRKEGDFLLPINVFDKKPDIRTFYDRLSFVEFVSDRTYKLFSKKTREVKKEDFELFNPLS